MLDYWSTLKKDTYHSENGVASTTAIIHIRLTEVPIL